MTQWALCRAEKGFRRLRPQEAAALRSAIDRLTREQIVILAGSISQ